MVQHGTEPSLRTKMTLFVAIWGHIFLFSSINTVLLSAFWHQRITSL
jgi:hypothetical protein